MYSIWATIMIENVPFICITASPHFLIRSLNIVYTFLPELGYVRKRSLAAYVTNTCTDMDNGDCSDATSTADGRSSFHYFDIPCHNLSVIRFSNGFWFPNLEKNHFEDKTSFFSSSTYTFIELSHLAAASNTERASSFSPS